MRFDLDDTIAALASPAGSAARGIVRMSGPAVREVLDRLFTPAAPDAWGSSRTARRHPGSFRLHEFPAALPAAVSLWPNRRSYTGQPSAEVHTVGSPPVLEALLDALFQSGARPARPGEFTLRAFLAGRLDLMQAEAVLGVIDAHDDVELETALRQLAGGISGPLAEVREDLLALLADLEAGLDFVDEDIEFISQQDLLSRIADARSTIHDLLCQASGRIQTTGRRQVALAGLPNAGKSTLFNALAGRKAALVSQVRGTTRDYLSAACDWNGMAIELFDTAGWEEAAEGIVSQAQRLGSERLQQADLILWCTAPDADEQTRRDDRRLREQLCRENRPLLVVNTKCDMVAGGEQDARTQPGALGAHFVRPQPPQYVDEPLVSAVTGEGLQELVQRAVAFLGDNRRQTRQLLGTTASRCRDSLHGAANALQRAGNAARSGAGDEIVTIDVREALDHLGHILGTVYTDDILDRIFSKFCIGK